MNYPSPIQNLINDFSKLPGLGHKTAERLVFYLIKKNDKLFVINFSNNLVKVTQEIKRCTDCGSYTEQNICSICADAKRDKSSLCLVAEPQDILYLEKTNIFKGNYFVLNGLLNPSSGITPEDLNIKNLFNILNKKFIKEIIFGFNPTIEGETTIIYLKKIIQDKFSNIKLTRLSRGLPMGADLEYADEITLKSAISNRMQV